MDPFTTADLRARYEVDFSAVLDRAGARSGELVRGELRPGGSERGVVRSGGVAPPAAGFACGAAQGDRARRPRDPRRLPARLAERRPPFAKRRWGRPPARGTAASTRARAAARGMGARRPAPPRRRVLAGVDGPALLQWGARMDRGGSARPEHRSGGAVLPRGPRVARSTALQGGLARVEISTPPCGSGLRRVHASSPTCCSTSSCRPRLSRTPCGTSPGPARRPTTRSRRCGRRG